MSDYQAIYDAVRSRIRGGNIGEVIREIARDAFDFSHVTARAQEQVYVVSNEMIRPSVLFRPDVKIDGNMYSVLYGSNLAEGCAGFGDSLAEAMEDFDKNWRGHKLSETGLNKHYCSKCGEPNPDKLDRDGCRDPACPEQS